jgi:hypothetical protein
VIALSFPLISQVNSSRLTQADLDTLPFHVWKFRLLNGSWPSRLLVDSVHNFLDSTLPVQVQGHTISLRFEPRRIQSYVSHEPPRYGFLVA